MYIWLCPCIGEIPIAMCHSCRVQQHPIAEVARRPWSRMCLGPQWAVLSTKKQFTNVYRIRIIHPKGQCFYVLRGKMMINHWNFVLQKYFFLDKPESRLDLSWFLAWRSLGKDPKSAATDDSQSEECDAAVRDHKASILVAELGSSAVNPGILLWVMDHWWSLSAPFKLSGPSIRSMDEQWKIPLLIWYTWIYLIVLPNLQGIMLLY